MPCLSYLEHFVSSWAAAGVLGLLSVIFSAPECQDEMWGLVLARPHGVLLPIYTWAPFHLGASPHLRQLRMVPWKMAAPALLSLPHVWGLYFTF